MNELSQYCYSFSVTMDKPMIEAVLKHCADNNIPRTVYIRSLIAKDLGVEDDNAKR